MAAAWALWALAGALGAWLLRPSAHAAKQAAADDGVQDALARRVEEAAQTWTAHVATAQGQLRDAVEQMLGSFDGILQQLDQLIGSRDDTDAATARVAMLAQCDAQLRGLLEQFNGFVTSRDEVLARVRTLGDASGRLQTMAEDVSSLARHTNLLAINAAIEAARAGPAGRGFAVVASEVRRLSAESGDTGRRIGTQVDAFNAQMQDALQQATRTAEHDSQAIKASEKTVGEVVAQVNAAVADLQERSATQSAQGEQVKTQVEQLLMAFQFQDRVHQILDQLGTSMAQASRALHLATQTGQPPDEATWKALLSEGYTTAEQRAVSRSPSTAAAAEAAAANRSHDTTFF